MIVPPIPRNTPTITRSVVLLIEEADRIDEWRREHRPGLPTISAAIRHLIRLGLDVEEMKVKRKNQHE